MIAKRFWSACGNAVRPLAVLSLPVSLDWWQFPIHYSVHFNISIPVWKDSQNTGSQASFSGVLGCWLANLISWTVEWLKTILSYYYYYNKKTEIHLVIAGILVTDISSMLADVPSLPEFPWSLLHVDAWKFKILIPGFSQPWKRGRENVHLRE